MGKPKIPKDDGAFDPYIRNTAEALNQPGPPPNYERLGLTTSENDEWQHYASDWKDIYPQYTDKNKRTSAITAQKNGIKEAFTPFAANLLTRMNTLPDITTSDRATFNIHERDTSPTKRGKINETPVVQLEPNAVATIHVRVRTSHDASRSSIHPLADGIEIRYALIVPTVAASSSPEEDTPVTPVTTKVAIPTMPTEAPISFVSTKALFELELPETASGKKLYAFLRWINQSDPKNNGPWTTVMQTNVL